MCVLWGGYLPFPFCLLLYIIFIFNISLAEVCFEYSRISEYKKHFSLNIKIRFYTWHYYNKLILHVGILFSISLVSPGMFISIILNCLYFMKYEKNLPYCWKWIIKNLLIKSVTVLIDNHSWNIVYIKVVGVVILILYISIFEYSPDITWTYTISDIFLMYDLVVVIFSTPSNVNTDYFSISVVFGN